MRQSKPLLVLFFFTALIAVAFAQSSVQLTPGDRGPIVFGTSGDATISTRLLHNSSPPVLSSCGGAGAAVVGSDEGGTVTVGSTLTTSCVITFTHAFGVAPACVLSPSSGVLAAFSYTVSTTAITVTQTSTASNTIQYVCVGKQ